jgi:hypothetical protein
MIFKTVNCFPKVKDLKILKMIFIDLHFRLHQIPENTENIFQYFLPKQTEHKYHLVHWKNGMYSLSSWKIGNKEFAPF